MMKRIFTLAVVAIAFGCSDAQVETGTQQTATQSADRLEQIRAKADNGRPQSDDVCEHYGLYDDEYCDRNCARPDPACDSNQPSADSLEWLCELEGESNNICIPVCGDRDVDCANEAPTQSDRCSGTYDDNDGLCDSYCFPDDHDCVSQNDMCLQQYRYADNFCDSGCAFTDPDCNPDSVGSNVITSGETGICSRFPDDPSLRRELASSLCIERNHVDVPSCIFACVRAAGGITIGGNSRPAPRDAGEQQPRPAAGDDSCRYANDGECDEGTWCAVGTDSTDCSGAQGAGSNNGGGGSDPANSCRYAYDNECDEPSHCAPGTDTYDCSQ